MLALGLQGSPNSKGSTDYLLKQFMAVLAARGLQTHTIHVAQKNIQPCKGCGYCGKKGICVIQDDDMQNEIYALLREAEIIVVATPVFFYSVPSQLKALIDRTQVFWSRKYRLQLPDPLQKPRKGFLLSLGGSQGKQLFTGVQLVAKYFFDAVDAQFVGSLTYRNIETRKDIMQHAELKNDIVRAVETILSPAPQPKPASNRESPAAAPLGKGPPYHESTKGRKHEK
jgi:multimeric flavodoxin WrbA